MISPKRHKLNCIIWFNFKTINNVAEYEAILVGLRLAKEIQVKRLVINSNFQLVVSQTNDNFLVKDKSMTTYLKLVLEFIPTFKRFELTQILRSENAYTNALSRLASDKDSELLMMVPIEHFPKRSTSKDEEVMWVEDTSPWMKPIIAYLKDQALPSSKEKAWRLRRQASHFVFQDKVLYKQGFSLSLLQSIGGEQANYVLQEIHERVCSMHMR